MAPRCRNMFFLALFAVYHAVLLPVSWTAAGGSAGLGGGLSALHAAAVQRYLIGAALSAAVFGTGWAYLLYSWIRGPGASRVFLYAQAASAVLFIVLACILLYSGHALVALFLFLVVLGDAAWFRTMQRDRLQFVELELQLVDRILFGNRSLILIMALLMAAQVALFLVWGSALVGAIMAPRATAALLFGFLFISLLWTTGVIKHTATTVVSSATTAWLSENARRRARDRRPPVDVPVDALTGGQPVPSLRDIPNAGVEEDDKDVAAVIADISTALRQEAVRPGAVTRGGAGDVSDMTLRDLLPATSSAHASTSDRFDVDNVGGLARVRVTAPAGTTPTLPAATSPGDGFVVETSGDAEHAFPVVADVSLPVVPERSDNGGAWEAPTASPSGSNDDNTDSDFIVSVDLWPVLRESASRSLGAIVTGALLGILSPVAWPLLRWSRHFSHMQNQLLAGLGRRAVVVLRAYLRVTNKCTAEDAGEGAEWRSYRF